MLLHLLRHGEPVLAGTMLGRTDCAVTEHGVAACVARVRELEVAAVVSSDLRRAAACADAVASARGLTVTRDARWRELDFGDWDGLAPATLDAEALARFRDDPDGFPPPGGERWFSLVARVGAAIDALDGPTLVVTHGGAMRAALAVLCGLGPREGWAIDLPYAALLSLRVWRDSQPAAQIVGLVT